MTTLGHSMKRAWGFPETCLGISCMIITRRSGNALGALLGEGDAVGEGVQVFHGVRRRSGGAKRPFAFPRRDAALASHRPEPLGQMVPRQPS